MGYAQCFHCAENGQTANWDANAATQTISSFAYVCDIGGAGPLVFDSDDNIYFCSGVPFGGRIYRIDSQTHARTIIAGTGELGFSGDGGDARAASFREANFMAFDPSGALYFMDNGNFRIRKISFVRPMVNDTTAPAITAVGPVYSSSTSIQSGSWISIYGTNLATNSAAWKGDFPTSLGGVSVTINHKPAYLSFVSPAQINLQAPDDTTIGTVEVVLTNGNGKAISTVTLAQASPSFSLLEDGKHVAGVIPTVNGAGAYGVGTYDLVGPSNSFAFNTRPVKSGETLVLYGVGFGPYLSKLVSRRKLTAVQVSGLTNRLKTAGVHRVKG